MNVNSQSKTNSPVENVFTQECQTFLRWVNVQLKKSNIIPINELQTDLCDGLVLAELFEILSNRKIGDKFTKVDSKLRQHHLNRIKLVLDNMRADNIETFNDIGMFKCLTMI